MWEKLPQNKLAGDKYKMLGIEFTLEKGIDYGKDN